MADQIVHEMISAFAAGCMDRQNYIHFKEYMQEGGDLPHGELGELQNIIAMIPIVLDLEAPDPAIKDMVAKKLIAMKDEIKAKIINERRTLANTLGNARTSTRELKYTQPPTTKPSAKTLSYQTKDAIDDLAYNLPQTDFKKTLFKRETIEKPTLRPTNFTAGETLKRKTVDDLKISTSVKPLPPIEIPTEEKSSGSNWISVLGIILTLVLFSIVGFYAFTSVSKLNDRIDELEHEIVALKSQLNNSSSFITNYSSVIEFFNNKDILVVNLANPNTMNKQTAKLLLSFGEKEGIIQFRNYQQLQPGQVFQLWAVNRGQSYSLGTFQPTGSEFLKISFPFLPKEQIEQFKVTIESGNNITTPSQNIFLYGVYSK